MPLPPARNKCLESGFGTFGLDGLGQAPGGKGPHTRANRDIERV